MLKPIAKCFCLLIFTSFLPLQGQSESKAMIDASKKPETQQAFLEGPKHRIEYFTQKPQGNGPFPILFLLHGHQPLENSLGGKQLVDLGYLDHFVKEGIIAVSISTPGFGKSQGARDFSGPNSQQAIGAVIEYFSHLPHVDSKRMGIYGISRGATLASMVHIYSPPLLLQILEAGWYDLTTCSSLLPHYLEKINETLLVETGGTKKDLVDRSACYNAEYIGSKTLILLGEFDDRRTLPSSLSLHKKLIAAGKNSQVKIFPSELHVLSSDKWTTLIPFVREHFFELYGIGIHVSLILPAIHVSKIYPHSPASLSKRLHVGDVILGISPQNDETVIDVLRMFPSQFTSLLLGKKGTSVRLHVQHFNQTYENIVIERGPIHSEYIHFPPKACKD